MSCRTPSRILYARDLCAQAVVLFVELALISGLKRLQVPATSPPNALPRLTINWLNTVPPGRPSEKRAVSGEAEHLRPHHVIEQLLFVNDRCLEAVERENEGAIQHQRIDAPWESKRQTVIVFRMPARPPFSAARVQACVLRVLTVTGALPGSRDRPLELRPRLVVTLSERRHQHQRIVPEYVTAQSETGPLFFPLAAYPIEIEGDLARLRSLPDFRLRLCR